MAPQGYGCVDFRNIEFKCRKRRAADRVKSPDRDRGEIEPEFPLVDDILIIEPVRAGLKCSGEVKYKGKKRG